MFTTNSCVKHQILHVLRDADTISHVKTGEINADVLIADIIRKCKLKKNNPQYLVTLYGDLPWNFACSFGWRISFFIEKIKKFCNAKKKYLEKNSIFAFWQRLALQNFFKLGLSLAYFVRKHNAQKIIGGHCAYFSLVQQNTPFLSKFHMQVLP